GFSEYLARKLYPDTVHGSKRYLYKDLDRAKLLKEKWIKDGKSPDEVDALLKKEAMEKISEHPFKYLAYTPVEAIKMTAFSYLPLLNEKAVEKYISEQNNGEVLLSLTRGIFRVVAYPILLLFIIGLMRHLKKWSAWLVLLTVILYFNLVYSLMDTIGRYAVPLIPFYCIFAVSAFFRLCGETT
ncbi:MAG: hypothetical protein HQ579_01215, partial [Candidatus Omnitrophica bacterium]|nr:hypothetical protein [Candidatus Omnitrophota bacterium]